MSLVAEARRASAEMGRVQPALSPRVSSAAGSLQQGNGQLPCADASATALATAPALAPPPLMVIPEATQGSRNIGVSYTSTNGGPATRLSVVHDTNAAASTQAAVRVLQTEIRPRRFSFNAELNFCSDLTLWGEVGQGGYGTVFAGQYRRSPVAVKVQPARLGRNSGGRAGGDIAIDAMEMAVLSAVQHPNIVALQTILQGMVIAEEGEVAQQQRFGPVFFFFAKGQRGLHQEGAIGWILALDSPRLLFLLQT